MNDASNPPSVHCPGCEAAVEPDAPTCATCGLRFVPGEAPDEAWQQIEQGAMPGEVDPIEALGDDGLSAAEAALMFGDTVTVFQGTMAEALAVRASLGARGFSAYLSDENTKVIDPFITGGNVFNVRVEVPTENADAVKDFLARVESRTPAPSAADAARARVERMGQNIIMWALILGGPIGIVFFARYLIAASGLAERPRDHATVVLFGLFCVAQTMIFAWILIVNLAR